jgi:uncharacterized protein (DUF305 family)
MTRHITTIATVSLISAFALTGCSASPVLEHNHDMTSTSSEMMSTMSEGDVMFAQMMIPHHEQAINMSTLAETRSQNADVLALARQIKATQAPEISQMTSWLTRAGAPMTMGHDMGDDGMLSEEEIAALSNASGVEFDKLYLSGMIAHHEGAIKMAQNVQRSTNSEVKTLSDAIIASQTAEIEKMKLLLESL